MLAPDPRIPVRFAPHTSASPGEVVLASAAPPATNGIEVAIWTGEHTPGCACCHGRSRLAEILSSLFVGAMRGARPRFSAIVADLDDAGATALREALHTDRFLAARYVAA